MFKVPLPVIYNFEFIINKGMSDTRTPFRRMKLTAIERAIRDICKFWGK